MNPVNAAAAVHSVALAQALASSITLVRRQFPAAQPNLSPWRDDPLTRHWDEAATLDLAFHFPGWSPRLQCRSLLLQLRFNSEPWEMDMSCPSLLGVVMRGMTFDGERWRLATLGDWLPAGPHLPQRDQVEQLQLICREMFEVFEHGVPNHTSS
ncbi:hypothetical protein [Synechococcus sp. CC9311]|uniref:hypothetical protein n=1 Tax=Synechococcus sp. (strain CC9311) TaxID=64471 RepID=UPI0000DDA9E8|nr:hypothetical protein [Synechococcus sp. CC9311]ABI46992.1 conserved hypothetical protein [Synechococcus sp. CC9311]